MAVVAPIVRHGINIMYGGGIVNVGIAVMHECLYCIVLMIVSAVYIISVFVIAQ